MAIEKEKKAKIDFFRKLPGDIIHHKILSLLTVEEAVATSTLSREWRDHWKSASLTHLNFNDAVTRKKPNHNPDPDHDPKTLFINFVNNVLRQNKKLDRVSRVTLSCLESYGSSTINTWLSEACMQGENIVELEVYANVDHRDPIQLPPRLYSSTSLVVLKLNADVNLGGLDDPNINVCFPSLKVLHICVHNPEDVNLTQRLYSRCPILEDLFLESLMLEKRRVRFEVCSSTLKRLRIELTLMDNKNLHLYDYTVLVKAENLEWLDVSDNFMVKYLFEDLNVLDRANVRIGLPYATYDREEHVFEFLKGLSGHVKSLSLSGCTVWVLRYCIESALDENWDGDDFTLPAKFTCLTNLEMGFRDFNSWALLPDILERSPNLESLALEKEADVSEFDHEEWRERWIEPKPTPLCVLHCLKVIGIKGFQGKQYELTVVKFLLEEALVLEKMVICAQPLSSDEQMMLSKTIFEYPRGSKDCQIIFFSDN